MGRSHAQQTGAHCQDAMALRTAGSLLVAIVCDGAGSAAWSYVGARMVADRLTAALSEIPAHYRPLRAHQEAVQAFVTDRLGAERRRLIEAVARFNGQRNVEAKDDCAGGFAEFAARLFKGLWSLEETKADGDTNNEAVHSVEIAERLRCTLVGALVDDSGGFLFHIGDGLASACALRLGNAGACVAEGTEIASPPENGQYANETFFVTDPDWRDHLRFTLIGPECDAVFLMTDGAAAFAGGPDQRSLFVPFANQLLPHLTTRPDPDLSDFLAQVLPPEKVHRVTADDATLVFAHKRRGDPDVSPEAASA
ncbi:protein phosphatase 2C domain-containing protein [Azospirillum soli]|uniref:protein phosphatase 2C domain-containing protein n=1 Tax=Azospirillum soli TaxID=1304799 RepID=UPI001FEA5257|nr:protein phosphatase 2C domain-containing protein [Azospirillum soli]